MGIERRRGTARCAVLSRVGLLAVVWLMVAPAQVGAAPNEADAAQQVEGETSAGADRSQAFVAMEGGAEEDVAGGPLLLSAYALVWVFVLGYVVVLARRTARTEREVARLSQALGQPPE